jgi:CheY-like chemotaxis protein
MPRMSGQQVVEELKRRQATVPVILISGQVADAAEPAGGAYPDAFIRKPFELVDLAKTVRRFVEAA